MPLKDIHAFMDYYRTNYHADIESIERSISGLSGSEREFQLNAEKIKLYSTFLDEHQFKTNPQDGKSYLDVFKETYQYLADWEAQVYSTDQEQLTKTQTNRQLKNKSYYYIHYCRQCSGF